MFQETQKPDFAQITDSYGSPDGMRAWQQRGAMLSLKLVEDVPC
jgi:hypothetical protein